MEAFTAVIQIVASVEKGKAIREVVQRAHNPVKDLLAVLGKEAQFARNHALQSYDHIAQTLEEKSREGAFTDPASAREAIAYLAEIKGRRDALAAAPSVEDVFTTAARAQDGLLVKVSNPSLEDWSVHLRAFRDQARAAKTAFAQLR